MRTRTSEGSWTCRQSGSGGRRGCLWQLVGLQGHRDLTSVDHKSAVWDRCWQPLTGPATRRWRSNRGVFVTNGSAGKSGGPLVPTRASWTRSSWDGRWPWSAWWWWRGGGVVGEAEWGGGAGVAAVYLPHLWLHMELGKCIQHDSIFSASPSLMVQGALEPITAVLGWGRGYTLNRWELQVSLTSVVQACR